MKKVLVTGASGGLGLYLSKSLLERGYFVIMHYYKNIDGVLKLHERYPEQSMIIKCNLEDELEVKKMNDDLSKCDISNIVINQGIEHLSNLEEKNSKTFLDVFKVNTLASFLIFKYFGDNVNKNHGHIVVVSSDNTIDKYDMVTLEYDVSKYGLNMLSKEFANYYLDSYINTICFGFLDTPMNDFPDWVKDELKFVPLQKASDEIIKLLECDYTGKEVVINE